LYLFTSHFSQLIEHQKKVSILEFGKYNCKGTGEKERPCVPREVDCSESSEKGT
jgi:hypothetical protein